jgi:hypothetical protein
MTTAAGYVSDTHENVAVDGKGRAPKFWWDTVIPDGDAAPWASAPLGSMYFYKPDESTQPAMYLKMGVAGSDDDWAIFSTVRQVSGQPMGLLLALTHK